MTLTAFILILISVFLHAGWNFLSKTNRPSAAFFLIVNGVQAILLPAVFFTGINWQAVDGRFYRYAAASVGFEVLYALGLFRAYKSNDISTAYPLARAIPVLLVAAVTGIFGIGTSPGMTANIGFAVVTAGCIILPQPSLSGFSWKRFADPVMLPILLAGIATTGYTIMDSQALKLLNAAAPGQNWLIVTAYCGMIEVCTALGLLILVLNSQKERAELRRCFTSPYPYLCGIFSCAAYLLVLAAMNFVTNVSFLQAFRQMSLPLGAAAGFWLLHEKITGSKITGILLILTGLILTVIK